MPDIPRLLPMSTDTEAQQPPATSPLPEALRWHRQVAGLTIEGLAERSQVSERTISDIERGVSRSPRASTIAALAAALDLSANDTTALLSAARSNRRAGATATAGSADRTEGDAPQTTSLVAPLRLDDFTGREREIGAVLAALGAAASDRTDGRAKRAHRVVLLHGLPGVGKTSTAVEALARYRDGEPGTTAPLFVDLGGIDPVPLSARDVVHALIRQLPGAPAASPTDLDDSVVLLGSLLTEHPTPLLLDDAADEAQLRPLLSSSAVDTVVITSRRSLAGLDGISRIAMQCLTATDSARLLERIVPADRRTEESIAEIALLCDDLPLALRIAGNRIASRPQWTAADFVGRLRDESRRLRSLVAGDQTVEAAFRLSYDQLDDDQSQQFRALALIEGATFDARVAAAPLGCDAPHAEDRLDELVDLGLIEARGGDRYAMHDLVRLFANERMHDRTDAAEIMRQRIRLRTWLLGSAERAGAWFEPARDATEAPTGPGLTFADPDTAQKWLRIEAELWFGAYRDAARDDDHTVVLDVADSLHWFSDLMIGWGHWLEVYTLSAAAAEATGDPHQMAVHLGYRAWAEVLELADFDRAAATAARARIIADAADDADQSGWARVYEAWALAKARRTDGVPALLQDAVVLFATADDVDGTVQALALFAQHDRLTGRPDLAVERYRSLLARVRANVSAVAPAISTFNEASTLSGIGENLLLTGEFSEALYAMIEAVQVAEKIDLPGRAVFIVWRAWARHGLGDASGARGDIDDARRIALEEGGAALRAQVESAIERASLHDLSAESGAEHTPADAGSAAGASARTPAQDSAQASAGASDRASAGASDRASASASAGASASASARAAPPGRDQLAGFRSELAHLPLRGREDVERMLGRAFDVVDTGASRALVLRGVAGVGKTRLLGEALARADARGWRTVVCAPDADAHLVPMGPLIEAATAAHPPLLDRAQIDTLTRSPDLRFWFTQALVEALETVAMSGGVAFVIDDLQWCDAGSLAALRTMVERLADLPILWLVAVRSGSVDAAASRAIDLLSSFGDVVDLEPLDDEAVSAIVSDLVGATPGPALEKAVKRAENLPLFVVELVHGLREEELITIVDTDAGDGARTPSRVATIVGDEVPARFGSSVRESLARLSAPTLVLVQVASVLGRRFPLEALAELAEVPTTDFVASVAEAVAAGILVEGPTSSPDAGIGFRHDVIREAAESLLVPSVRMLLRRRAADVRVRLGEPVLAVAESVAETAVRGDREAITLLHDAALQLSPTDATSAADLAVRAMALAAGDARFAPMLARLIPVLWRGGRLSAVHGLAAELRGLLDADAEASVGLAIARLETESSFADALRTCDEALGIVGASAGIRAQLLAVRALNTANIADYDHLPEAIARAREAALAVGDDVATATVDATDSVLMLYLHRFDDAQRLIDAAVDRLTAATGISAAQWVPEGLWPAFLANTIGHSTDALRMCDTSLAETRRTRNAPAMAFWMMVRSRVLFDLGRLDDARMQAETVIELAGELALGDFTQATAGAVLFRVALYTGDRETHDQRLPFVQAMADGAALHRSGAWLLAIAADDTGDRARAFDLTESAFATLEDPTPSMTTPSDFADDADLARMSIRVGDTSRLATIVRVAAARALANPHNPLAEAVDRWVAGLVDADAGRVRQAVAALRPVERPLVLACALEDLGRLENTTDARAAARSWVEAARLYEAAGAIRDAGRVRQLLREVGVIRRPRTEPAGELGLTTRELQVVARLAAGSTTQQIATDLYLSPHTVVTHIRHIYSKWGVNSRKAMAERYRAVSGASPVLSSTE